MGAAGHVFRGNWQEPPVSWCMHLLVPMRSDGRSMSARLQALRLLRAYKADSDQYALFDGITMLLRAPERHELLLGFAEWVVKPQQAWFKECVR